MFVFVFVFVLVLVFVFRDRLRSIVIYTIPATDDVHAKYPVTYSLHTLYL